MTEANETNAALNQTLGQLQGGLLRVGIGSAIPVVAGWEQTLKNSPSPDLAAVGTNLGSLRTMLAADDFDPAEVGALLMALGDQVQALTATPYGLPIAVPLSQLSLLLKTGGTNLAQQARR